MLEWTIWNFLAVAVVFFGVAMIALGIFSAYFGKGKNRTYGLVLAIVGVIALAALIWLKVYSGMAPFTEIALWDSVRDSLLALVAVLIGVLVAAGIFLVTILKS